MVSEAQNCKYKVNILRVKGNQQYVYFLCHFGTNFHSANPNFQLRPKLGRQISLWTEFLD